MTRSLQRLPFVFNASTNNQAVSVTCGGTIQPRRCMGDMPENKIGNNGSFIIGVKLGSQHLNCNQVTHNAFHLIITYYITSDLNLFLKILKKFYHAVLIKFIPINMDTVL